MFSIRISKIEITGWCVQRGVELARDPPKALMNTQWGTRAANAVLGPMLINAVDRLGRKIDPAVLAAAEEIGPRALQCGERLLRDSALAATLLEESAATVSRAIMLKRNTGAAGVRNLQAYVFRAFLRRVNRVRRKDPILANSARLNPALNGNPGSLSEDFELKVLVDEFLTRCDPVIRDMFYRRMQGFSWKEIARVHGTSAHAAEARFSQALRRVRERLGLDR